MWVNRTIAHKFLNEQMQGITKIKGKVKVNCGNRSISVFSFIEIVVNLKQDKIGYMGTLIALCFQQIGFVQRVRRSLLSLISLLKTYYSNLL